MTRRRLLSLLSLCWLLGLAQAVQSWPRGGAWFGRQGNGKEKTKPTALTDSNVNETKATKGGGIKRSTKWSSPRKNEKKKVTRNVKKIRKKKRKVATPAAAVETDTLSEEGQSKDRSTTRSRRPKHRHRTAIKGEPKKVREKARVGPDQKPIRTMKKRKKHTSSLMQAQQPNSDMVMLEMTVADDDQIEQRNYRQMKRSIKGSKRHRHKSAPNQFPPRPDGEGPVNNQANRDMEPRVRSKKVKKNKEKKNTSARSASPVSVFDDKVDSNLRSNKSKKRKRARSKVKGELKIGHVYPVAKANLDSVEKVEHANQKIKRTLKKKKVKKVKHHKAQAVSSEGRVASEKGQNVSVDLQAIEMIHLPDSSKLSVDDAMTSLEPMDDGKLSDLPQLEGLHNPVDPIVHNAVREGNLESPEGIDLSSALYQAVLGTEQGKKVSDESALPKSKGYESQQVDRSVVPDVDRAVADPASEQDSAEPQENEAHNLTMLQNQVENKQEQCIEKESSLHKEQVPEEEHGRAKFKELDASQEHLAEVAIDGELVSNVSHTLNVNDADDDDALDELVEALIQDQLDESEVIEAAGIVDISEHETLETSLEASEEGMNDQENEKTRGSGSRSLPLRSSSFDHSVDAPSVLFDTKDEGFTTENPDNVEVDDVIGKSLTQQTIMVSQNNIDYGSEEDGKSRERIRMETYEHQGANKEETTRDLNVVSDQTDDFEELRAVTYPENLTGDAIDDINHTDVLSCGSFTPRSSDVNAVVNDEDDVETLAGDGVEREKETAEVDAAIIESGDLTVQESQKDIIYESEEDEADEADGKHIKGEQAITEPDVLATPDFIEIEAVKQLDRKLADNDIGTENEMNGDAVSDSELEILSDPTPLKDMDQVKSVITDDQHDHEMEPIETSLNINESSTYAWSAGTEDTPTNEVESVLLNQDEANEAATQGLPPWKPLNEEVSGSQSELVKTDVKSIIESSDDPSDITVSVVSWNLAEAVVPEEDAAFIRKFRKTPSWRQDGEDGTDIVLISSQECENIKPRRSEGHRSRELRRLMIKMLGKNYVPLAIHSLGGIQFGLFCKRSILSEIEFVSVADVTCGIGNVFHNKGAIAAFLQMKSRDPAGFNAELATKHRAKSVKMLFVTAHLAAHVKNVDARNMDYWRIASELQAQAPSRFLPPKQGRAQDEESNGTGSHLIDSVDRIFFCGDLNYRLDLPREIAENSIIKMKRLLKAGDAESLRKAEEFRLSLLLHDQLRQVLAQGAAFPGFAEGRITFMPTFKFDKDTTDYDTSHKQRIPAWTDRVLFKPFGTRVLEYTSEEDSQHSDHRPVHATFRVSTLGREVAGPRKGTRQRSRRTSKKQRNRP